MGKNASSLQSIIQQALQKIKAKKESAICRYLPAESGGYMHHFTFRKMKKEAPEKLKAMVKEFVLDEGDLKMVTHKPRAAKGSRKRRDVITFSKVMLSRMRDLANRAGDVEMLRLLNPPKPVSACKKELMASIRRGEADESKWREWCQALQRQAAQGNQQPNPAINDSGILPGANAAAAFAGDNLSSYPFE